MVTGAGSVGRDPRGDAAPRTLVVTCADWPVRAAGLAGVDRPVAVWSHRGIEAANSAARAAGVRVGLRRREAQGRCPELELVVHDPARDARCFDPVVAALGSFTPQVEIVRPGVAAMGTRGPSRYFGGDTALADRVLDTVVGVATDPAIDRSEVRVGVADGPLVARLAARHAPAGGVRIVDPGGAAAFVGPLPIGSVAPFVSERRILDVWRQLGLRTLAEVAALPAAAVLGRFGSAGVWIHRLAAGDDPSVTTATPLPDDVDEAVAFDPPEWRADAVAFATRAAAGVFADRLARSGLSCAQVVVTLWTDHAEVSERRWRLDGPGRDGERPDVLIAERVRWQTDGWTSGPVADRPTAGIIRVVLAPGEIRPARGRQAGFWGGASAADERAARAVARLEAIAGPDAVCVVVPRGGRDLAEELVLVPTATFGTTRPGGPVGAGADARDDGGGRLPGTDAGRGAVGAPWPGRLPSPAPATVLVEPRPVVVTNTGGADVEVTGRGELRTPPATVTFPEGDDPTTGRPGPVAVVAWAGPWPVEERWWDPARHCRQARLQLVTADGRALLVIRRDRRWWLRAIHT